MASIYLFLAVEAMQKKEESKYLLLFFIMLTFAILTKGVACLMQIPGLFIYVLARKKILPFLKDKAFYTGLSVFIIFGIGYYFLRENINPGYLKAVWENDLGGRYVSVNEGHRGPFSFYWNELMNWQFVNYYLLFPFAVIVGLGFSENRIQRLVGFALISALSFLLIISMSSTKLPHYDAPLFPYLAIIIAALFYGLYKVLITLVQKRVSLFTTTAFPFMLTLCLLIKPYSDIIASVYFPKGDIWEEDFSKSCEFFQALSANKETMLTNKLIDNYPELKYGASAVIYCYREELAEHGKLIQIIKDSLIQANDTLLMIKNWELHQKLEKKFTIVSLKNLDKYNMDCIWIKAKTPMSPLSVIN